MVIGVVLFCLLNLTNIFGKKHQTLADLFSAYFIFDLLVQVENH